ncbi:MAG: hypothetical protein ABT20_02705 [Rubrivivax sp. SCN 70-15]|nr:MAG: hypothetical protein ABT20_02705 [Rubrivivax sp. SCN 70-15]
MMSNIHRLLPRLVLNRRLLQALVDEHQPSCMLGFVQERQQVLPLIALGLREIEDLAQLGDGFRLGHQVVLVRGAETLRLDFEFQGRMPLQVLLNPTNIVVQRVLEALAEAQGYFVLVVGAHGVTTFRADNGAQERQQFGGLCRRDQTGTIRPDRFASLERTWREHSTEGASLVWLGRDDPGLLDLSGPQRYELRPAV